MEITAAKVVRKLKSVFGFHSRKSYGQLGEDLLLAGLLNTIGIQKPYYVDIGAHHPKKLSNTYFFYKKGAAGICIEPDPDLFNKIRSVRGRDLCLNMGIGKDAEDSADFYVMSAPTLNTFSKKDAEVFDKEGVYKIVKVIKLPLVPVNIIFARYASKPIDLVSIDVEGLDLDILRSIDYNKYRPKFFCVESLTRDSDDRFVKHQEMLDFMASVDYIVVADTWLNTIFVDKKVWANRPADS